MKRAGLLTLWVGAALYAAGCDDGSDLVAAADFGRSLDGSTDATQDAAPRPDGRPDPDQGPDADVDAAAPDLGADATPDAAADAGADLGPDAAAGCGGPDDCPPDQTCGPDGQCIPRCAPGGCDEGSHCGATWWCEPGGCAADADCAPGGYCQPDGRCAQGCRRDPDDCPQGEFCGPDRVCVPGAPCEAGAACDTGALGDCAAGATACNADGTTACEPAVEAGQEQCGGGDEDCDGQTDEGFDVGADCAVGEGACRVAGQVRCTDGGDATCAPLEDAPRPQPEACNGRDDDCDGATDETFGDLGQACAVGVGGCAQAGVVVCTEAGGTRCDAVAGAPTDEACDGIDNDCDGTVDEMAGGGILNERCYTGPEGTRGVGACRAGNRFCVDGAWSPCDGEVVPQAEACNNVDDDCNRLVDDDLGGPLLRACYGGPEGTAGVGVCAAGEQQCAFGEWSPCAGEVLPGNEICDQADNDCDGEVDDGLPGGCQCDPGDTRACYSGPEGTAGVGACAAGTQTCLPDGSGWGACAGETTPAAEVCDGADNDCNGQADDAVAGVGEACTLGLGQCERPGTRVCDGQALRCDAEVVPPVPERCDGLDNDCDGNADEVFPLDEACQAGVGACARVGVTACSDDGRVVCGAQAGEPVAELCNGVDDDCDGSADETFPVGQACAAGQGECRADGTWVCDGQGAAVCDADLGQPADEVCNQLDDDCDGQPDEGLGLGEACAVGVGACARQGARICGPNGAAVCSAAPGQPVAEVCNGVDDDCDGQVDDGVEDGGVCATGEPGVCRTGRRQCVDGGRVCVPVAQPSAEVCNGLDDDCDGQVDEDTGRIDCGQGLCARELPACTDGRPTVCDPLQGAQDQELCNGIDDDCDGETDEVAAGDGLACGNGTGACQRPGVARCVDGALGCDAVPGDPQAETCNQLDDDCDGLTDEQAVDPDEPCFVGVGACRQPGVPACADGQVLCVGQAGQPAPEVCNSVDDDCDGQADEGFGGQVCGQGQCRRNLAACDGGAVPECDPFQGAEPERCDGVDNDCDGNVDEAPGDVGGACQSGQGLCRAEGFTVCVGGQVVCGAAAGAPADEVCNGLDDDCDGRADEEAADAGDACSAGTGACRAAGAIRCVDAQLVCDAAPGQAAAEACNGEDDDCDGVTDEGLGTVNCGQGACQRDLPACVDGAPPACDPQQGAGAEACNGVDDDCDGVVDEDAAGAGAACQAGQGACAAAGVQVCQGGDLLCDAQQGEPQLEACDAVDNDCDGRTDEGFDLGQACQAGVGECRALGRVACAADGGATCDAELNDPAPEECNGLDDDCDGQIDEGTGGNACDTGQLGVCAAGLDRCQGGVLRCDRQGAPAGEACDGLDNDCDGEVDDGLGTQPCGVGECARELPACTDGAPTVCDPRAGAQPELCNGLDDDCDGLTDEAPTDVGQACAQGQGACERSGFTVCQGGQVACDAQPGAPAQELCNGVDDDCDGQVDDNVAGIEQCTAGVGQCARAAFRECVDGGFVCPAQAGDPGAEVCNGLDDDCDGELDEGFGSTVCGVGQCRNAVPNCDGGQAEACDPFLGAEPERCDGVDNDCDGSVDEDAPGVGEACGAGVGACRADGVTVCADGQIACGAQPGEPAAEQCNGADDDCDGATDEEAAGVGAACSAGIGACAAEGQRVCQLGRLECDAQPLPPADEVCDGVDNDCDGLRDEALGTITCGEGLCRQVVAACQNGQVTVCDPLVGAQPEACNGFDDDCDGQIDEGFGTQQCGQGVCARELPVCQGGQAVACDPLVGANPEVCNGLDDDCDGRADEGIAPEPCNAGIGQCAAAGFRTCEGGQLVCSAQPGDPVAEGCNGRDDDCDGEVDEAPLADVGEACERGIGACRDVQQTVCDGGFEVCPAVAGEPQAEICDGLDNDCDNRVDEDGPDCDANGFGDACDLAFGRAVDCDGNQIPDACDIAEGRAEDCNDNGVPDQCNNDGADCVPDVTPPVVDLFLQGNVVNAGSVIQVVVQVEPDESGIAERGLTLNGQPVAIDQFGQAFVELAEPGFQEFVGFAVDGAGNRGEDRGTVRVLDPADVDPPELVLHSPPNGQPAEGVLSFVITATDANMASWRLTWGPQGDAEAALLAEGDENVVNQEVATLDTAGLAAGRYDIRLVGQDINGRGLILSGFFTIENCEPQPELCDSRDNDCDGTADEDFPGLGQACNVGQGACFAEGTLRCLADFSGAACDAVEGLPQIELCNALDDDCDGRVDERWPLGQVCSAGVGECEVAGAVRCTGDQADAACDAVAGQPVDELCDGLDNDCDGDIDEGILGCGVDTPPTVDIVARPEIVAAPGEPVEITVVSDDDVGVVFLQLTIDGVVTPLDAGGQVIQVFDRAGLYTLVAIARDAVDQEDTAELVVRVLDPLDNANPFVEFYEPRPDEVVDREIAVRGEVLDENPVLWRLTYGPPGDSGANLLAEGVDNIAGELARFSPDLMPNGFVELQLYAEDVNGRAAGVTRRFRLERCEAIDEICDGADNDCDDQIDEGLIGCAGDEEPPQVTLFVPADVVNSGTALDVQVTAVDNIRVDSLTLTLNGNLLAPNGAGVVRVLLDQPGRALFVATAVDGAGNTDTAEHLVRVLDPNDADFPEIELISPPSGSNLEAATAVVATVQDQNPWQWWLYQGTVADPQQTLVNTGFTNVENGVLGIIDPAGLPEGEYRFQIVMEDANGRQRTLTAAFVVQACEPGPEICNLTDDDCDGQIDETFADLGNPCSAGVGACEAQGTVRCRADFGGTVCDAQPGQPALEACNDADDDCDGLVDEAYPVGQACAAGEGQCRQEGLTVCRGDGQDVQCNATPGAPGEEVCDQADNDCDGEVDEGFDRVVCGQGACERVIGQCPGDPDIPECDPFAGASPELCNGVDDDCDGAVDEAVADAGNACAVGQGACAREGTEQCVDGALACDVVAGQPVDEICDELDNDCDGAVDEGFVCPDETPPEVVVNLQINIVDPGQAFWVQVLAQDDRGAPDIALTVAGQPVPVDENGIGNAVAPNEPGRYPVVATVTDAGGNVTVEQAELLVRDPGDVTPPTVEITSPTADQKLLATLDVTGTATDPNLVRWTLSFAERNGDEWITLAEGGAAVEDGTFGQIKPGLFENGMYTLRLDAQDINGQIGRDEVVFTVDGQAKVGAFRMEFIDANINVAGAPLTVKRIYDSRTRFTRDFGLGWTLDVKAGKVEHNRDPAVDWEITVGGGFIALPCQQAAETAPHVTEVRISDKEMYAFRPELIPGGAFLGGCQATYSFEFVSGTVPGVARLQIIGDNQVAYLNGDPQLYTSFFDEEYEVNRVRLTTPDGREFDLDLDGAFRVGDSEGNAVSIDDNGLTHNAGESVEFVRDAQGRITQLIEPGGDSIRYEYENGDLVRVIDQLGNTTTFVYDDAHHLLEVLDPLGRVPTRQEFDEDGRLVAVVDGDGNRQVFDRNLEGRQEIVTDRLGQVQVFVYDEDGNVLQQTDKRGNQRVFTYDADNRKLSEADEGGEITRFEYDAQGREVRTVTALGTDRTRQYDGDNNVIQETDFDGAVTTYAFDGRKKTRKTDPAGHVTTWTYNNKGQPLTMTEPGDAVWAWTYDAKGRVTTETNPLGHVVSYTYDAKGNRTSETRDWTGPGGPQQVVVRSEYDAKGNRTRTIDATGGVTAFEYNEVGKLVRETDPEGHVTRYEYDGVGNQTAKVWPNGAREEQEWDPEGRRTAAVDPDGRRTEFGYDANGNLTTVVFPDLSRIEREYDARNLMVSERDAEGRLTRYEYDALGRNTAVEDPLGQRTVFEYDAVGRRTAAVYPDNARVEMDYDPNGELIERRFADGARETWTYDQRGNKASWTNVAGEITTYEYDGLNRLLAVEDTLGQRTEYAYDELGNRVQITDANGHITRHEFDAAGRHTAVVLPGGERAEFTYDRAGRMVSHLDFDGVLTTYTLDPMGKLIRRETQGELPETAERLPSGLRTRYEDARGVETWAYDERGRVVTHDNPDGVVVRWGYDATGRVVERTDPTGITRYEYDPAGRLAAVVDPDGGRTTYGYNPAGSLETVTYPNGVATTNTYDVRQRLTGMVTRDGGGQVLAEYRYTVGANGERLRSEELHRGRTVDYTYDALYRLTQERITEPGGAVRTIDYTYDAVGNRLTRTDSDTGLTEYVYDANDRLLQAGGTQFEYDPKGNLIRKFGAGFDRSYVYDARNRLVMADDGQVVVEYTYDMDGNRVATTIGQDVQRFVWDTHTGVSRLLQVTDNAGQQLARYVHGADLISQQTGEGLHYYVYDGQLSTRHLTDAAGARVATYDYDAFGNELFRMGEVANPFTYGGEYVDGNTGFVYLRARWMDPETGRFNSHDPAEGQPFDPATFHRYTYVENDPIGKMDPSGKFTMVSISISISISGSLRSIYTGNLVKTFLKVNQIAQCVLRAAYSEMNTGMEMALAGIPDGFTQYASGRRKVAAAYRAIGAAIGATWQNILDDMVSYKASIDSSIDLKIGTLTLANCSSSGGAGSGAKSECKWLEFKPVWEEYYEKAEKTYKTAKKWYENISGALAGDACAQAKLMEDIGNKLISKMPKF